MGPETEYALIPLTHGRFSRVDGEDWNFLMQFKWHLAKTGYADTSHGRRRGSRIPIMHRLLAKTPEGMDTDHINGDKLDNRKANLRICTHAENCRNSRPRKNRGHKGVSWNKALNLWVARVTFEGHTACKYFKDSESAAKWYVEKVTELHGEFARSK